MDLIQAAFLKDGTPTLPDSVERITFGGPEFQLPLADTHEFAQFAEVDV